MATRLKLSVIEQLRRSPKSKKSYISTINHQNTKHVSLKEQKRKIVLPHTGEGLVVKMVVSSTRLKSEE